MLFLFLSCVSRGSIPAHTDRTPVAAPAVLPPLAPRLDPFLLPRPQNPSPRPRRPPPPSPFGPDARLPRRVPPASPVDLVAVARPGAGRDRTPQDPARGSARCPAIRGRVRTSEAPRTSTAPRRRTEEEEREGRQRRSGPEDSGASVAETEPRVRTRRRDRSRTPPTPCRVPAFHHQHPRE